jgi:hypothetical protein
VSSTTQAAMGWTSVRIAAMPICGFAPDRVHLPPEDCQTPLRKALAANRFAGRPGRHEVRRLDR